MPSLLSDGRAAKRAAASVVSRAVLIIALALLLIFLAACGDDDDGTQLGRETGSPASSLQTTSGPSPTNNSGSGNEGGQGSPASTSSAGEQTPPPGSGTAIIDGVQYEFTANLCTITPSSVTVLGLGQASDGRPFIASATWYQMDIFGNAGAVTVSIHTNKGGLFDPADQAFAMGNYVANSTVESIDIDATGFDVTVTGTFVDLGAPETPPVEGSFTLSCS